MRNQVLIVTEEWAGSGHYMAAIALQEALLQEECEVSVVGGLGVASPLLRKLSRTTYYSSLAYFPALWDHLYNREPSVISKTVQKPLAKALGKRLLERVIEQQKPDIVVSTHAYCLSALAEAKKKASKPFQMLGVLTDYHIHPYWLHHSIDYYSVAHSKLAEKMSGMRQIQPERIRAFGIPLRQAFNQKKGRSKLDWKRSLGLETSKFTVLLCGGNDGYGDMLGMVARLLQCERPLVIIAVTGKNARLKNELQQVAGQIRTIHALYVYGYVEAMWELLGAADAVITKAGGLTCSEALAMRTPLILYQPLPGQERQNSHFLVEQGVAWQAETVEEAALILERLQAKEQESQIIIQRMEEQGKSDAAGQVAKWIKTVAMNDKQVFCSGIGNISRLFNAHED